MATIGIRALQQNASAAVARAAEGEIIEVTDRGRPVACLVPLPTHRLAALVRAGLARPARRRLADLGPALPGDPSAPSLGDLLADARADER
jgi:prevent-host-death family protein